MSTLNLQIITARPVSYIQSNFETAGGPGQIVQRIVDYIQRVMTGNESAQDASNPPTVSVSCIDSEGVATGTLIFTSVVATNTFSINGVTFTCVASGATGNQFNVGGTDILTAAAAAAAVNASVTALIAGYVSCPIPTTSTLVVNSLFPGPEGNMTAIASGQGTIVASGAHLTGGSVDASAKVIQF